MRTNRTTRQEQNAAIYARARGESPDEENQAIQAQLREMRDKLDNVVDLMSDQQMTNDLRQRLVDELMAVESVLANAGEVVRSAYTRKK